MKLRTLVRDGLYLNWALPAEALLPPPPPLVYERHAEGGREWVFASVLLFRQEGLHLPALPVIRLSHPQANLRLHILDGDRMPSVLFRRMLVPAWVTPAARLFGRQPARPARFDYPRPSDDPAAGEWRWRVRAGATLEVTARRGAPMLGTGPRLGSWEATVRYFRDRRRGYAEVGRRLRRIDTEHPPVAVWPLTAEVTDASLLEHALPLAGGREGGGGAGPLPWPPLHSAWLCPEIPFVFELGTAARVELGTGRLPQAAASSRSRL
jgi:hypothetical protein